ncbi:hypothetical protein, partial [Escherichia coli]|uniref:hypothetical protein n=1 Tax=Escherichia coli TaxID=562 RepID=UPI0039A4ED3A
IRKIREMRTYMFLRRWLRNMCGLRRENPSGRWLRSLREHNHLPLFFSTGALATKKSEPLKGPPRFFGCQWLNFRRLPD